MEKKHNMNVLIACEFSGIVRDAFKSRGHFAVSCDLLDSERQGLHIKGDILDVLDSYRNRWFTDVKWDMMIAHPPCTYLANSGVSWLYRQDERWEKMIEGAEFFKTLLDAPIPHIAVENPIMHKYAVEVIGRRQDQLVQPYMFGHPERKATCFWLKNLPPLKETKNVKEEMLKLPKNQAQRLHYTPPSKDRWKIRSRTFQGIADAMAQQWGDYIKQ